ncbi:class A beta-lactamase-related serine hydrolase [Streptomyces sp. col6]|uniref:serine hydrolase domain-containing protein n=1 Tax=Streptomyces sp. col6 TaxID=2478958 RepID=UPI0011CE8C31|nr:serine hydrolase domain-containing protein [Streptomyces sp. col6]TXS04175.1 class A beta-lactamase-related serine hydrolase [Streptomyces sp. col6]
MSTLREVLEKQVRDGSVPGAVGLVARGRHVDVAAAGSAGTDDSTPMARDSLFRIASVTKPVTAAAVMMLVEDGRIALDDPVAPWLPELAAPVVVRTPESPVDDVVPASRAITLLDLMTSRAGYGFPSDFSLPAVALLSGELKQGSPLQSGVLPPDAWMEALSRIPLLSQPGREWLYNTCSDILGVLIARVAGQPLPEFFAERIFAPLGMSDTGFAVPAEKLGRFTALYRPTADGGLELIDTPAGQWSGMPDFPSGAGGLVSTVDDLYAFARMLLDEGTAGGKRLLTSASVRQMTTDHLTPAQREASGLFTEGQGWGFGGSVDIDRTAPWNVPGRYGWVGGTGTTAHIVPATGTAAIMLSQVELTGPTPPRPMRDFWQYAADA